MGRQEFWTVSENRDSKRLGFEVYWTEGDPDKVDLRIGSDNWNHKQEHPIVKMYYMRQKSDEEDGDYPDRTIWKDKSIILLDSAGKVFKTKQGYKLNEQCKKIYENCIDIQVDAESFFVKHLVGGGDPGRAPAVEIQSINVQNLAIKKENEDLRWPSLMDRLGPLSYQFASDYPIGGLYERTAPEWNQAQC